MANLYKLLCYCLLSATDHRTGYSRNKPKRNAISEVQTFTGDDLNPSPHRHEPPKTPCCRRYAPIEQNGDLCIRPRSPCPLAKGTRLRNSKLSGSFQTKRSFTCIITSHCFYVNRIVKYFSNREVRSHRPFRTFSPRRDAYFSREI